jgi:predicted phosphodiesterase
VSNTEIEEVPSYGYKQILTEEFLKERITKTTKEISEETGIPYTTVRNYRKRHNLPYIPPQVVPFLPLDKKMVEDDMTHDEYLEQIESRQEFKKRQGSYHQTQITVRPPNPDLWMAFAVVGDLHDGDENVDTAKIRQMKKQIKETPNLFMIVVGDLMSGKIFQYPKLKYPEFPHEFDPLTQQKMALKFFQEMGKNVLAFCVGNHDLRDSYKHIGELVAPLCTGGYLGYGGILRIKFSDDLTYTIYLTHEAKGFSQFNKLHGNKKIAMFEQTVFYDIVATGHIHGLPPITYDPADLNTYQGFVRAGGYWKDQSWYEKQSCFKETGSATPVILLCPTHRKILILPTLEDGIDMLEKKNSKIGEE